MSCVNSGRRADGRPGDRLPAWPVHNWLTWAYVLVNEALAQSPGEGEAGAGTRRAGWLNVRAAL
jgi:hypothetical protein